MFSPNNISQFCCLPCNKWRTTKNWLILDFILNFRWLTAGHDNVGILPTFHTIFTCHLSSPIITAIFTMILHWFLVASSKLRKACQKYHSSVCHNSGLEQYWRKISKIAVLAAAVKAASEVNARALLYCCLTRACYATLRALDFCERGMASTCAVTPFTNQLVSWIPLQGSALFFLQKCGNYTLWKSFFEEARHDFSGTFDHWVI